MQELREEADPGGGGHGAHRDTTQALSSLMSSHSTAPDASEWPPYRLQTGPWAPTREAAAWVALEPGLP